ncbi:MAG: aminoglycoside phosphotransferase family protein [Chloroflexi bacterium]|nr:aminoglycoside phosphotransferase family protein [Chloroflexota bacterium]
MAAPPPPARGVRLDWYELPARVRMAFDRWSDSRVESASSQPGGFSPGVAARLRLADGRRVFAKAVCARPNAEAPAFHRREARIVAALPPGAPVPRLVWSMDEGDDGWVVLAFQDIEGRAPAQPWDAVELQRVLDALTELTALLTPSPVSVPPARRATTAFARRIRGWQELRDADPLGRARLDPWSARHLDRLAELEAEAVTAVEGETLLHFDLRADNLLLTPERVWFVDWPHAAIGAGWVDAIAFAPSVTMQGGPPPKQILRRAAPNAPTSSPDVTAAIASVAGFFTRESVQPPPPGLPTLRPFQAAQAHVARSWLSHRVNLY